MVMLGCFAVLVQSLTVHTKCMWYMFGSCKEIVQFWYNLNTKLTNMLKGWFKNVSISCRLHIAVCSLQFAACRLQFATCSLETHLVVCCLHFAACMFQFQIQVCVCYVDFDLDVELDLVFNSV